MQFDESFIVAFDAIRTNKTRTFLTMLGIIIGVSAVILLVAIGSGLKNYVLEQFESLGANTLVIMPGELSMGSEDEGGGMPGGGVTASKFTFDHLKELERKGKTIKTVMAYMENNAKMRYKGKTHVTQVAGVGPQYQEIRSQKVISGSFFTLAQYNSSKRVCVLGATVVEELFAQTNPLGKKITIADQQYTVLGVLEEKGSLGGIDMDDQVFIPATTALRQFDMEYIQSFLVQSENPQVIPQTINEIEKILLKYFDEDEFSVLDTKNILQAISQVLSALTLALAGIAAISLVVGGIGIMNIMLVSVTERTREIGLRKAVGAKPKDILFQFLVEAVILSLVGGILGISFGVLGSLLLRKFIKTAITSWSIIIAFSVSALVGVIFGVAPAAKAAKLDPIESLRYE